MNIKHRSHILLSNICLLSMIVCSGCATYRPDPPDFRKHTETWKSYSLQVAPAGKLTTIPWKQLSHMGLLLNPDLNKARIKFLSSKHSAKYAGLWDDPTLNLNAARYLPGVMYDRGASLGLSIPVSGRTELARRVAELYTEADYRELRAMETDYLMRLQALCYNIRITHTKHELIRSRLRKAEAEQDAISRLHALGEATASDLQDATQRRNDLIKEEQELESVHLEKHLELMNMLGLYPRAGDIEVAGDLPTGVPSRVKSPTEEDLLLHPRLQAAISVHRTSEAELRLEIRKQYPDISLSPGFTHEEGDNKLTLDVGFTLPLWNRNREAIARAYGSRRENKLSAIYQYHELVQQAAALSRKQDLALKHCRTEYERLGSLLLATTQQEELYKLGEIDLPTLAGSRHETYTRQLAYLDCLAELLEIQVALNFLSHPQDYLPHTLSPASSQP